MNLLFCRIPFLFPWEMPGPPFPPFLGRLLVFAKEVDDGDPLLIGDACADSLLLLRPCMAYSVWPRGLYPLCGRAIRVFKLPSWSLPCVAES